MQNLILNRYRPLEQAGSGGFATVVAAWDTRIQRRVAMKCLPLDGYIAPADPRTPREIPGLPEARTAAMLNDPHIVGVYDFDVSGPAAYIIMEYIDGVTLTELMRREGPLPLDVVTCVFESVSRALETAHENQVLHLDIKPDNVLINRQGQVKVADFGLAQLSHAAGFGRAAGGTIGYMPLEQMRLEPLDVRCDEWALAALTYQMLVGENPFAAPDLQAAERAIEQAEVVIPSMARSDVGEEVDEAIFGALAINREDRFESVALFADCMMPYLGNARRGAKQLAVLVGDACDDGDEEEYDEYYDEEAWDEDEAELPQRRRARRGMRPGRAAAIAYRAWAALTCGGVAALAAFNISACVTIAGRLEPAFWIVVLAAAALAAVWPGAGAMAAVAALVAALALSGAPVLAAVLGIVGLAWGIVCGARKHAAACVGASVSVAGAVGLAALAPLAAGYFLRVRDAVATAVFAVVVAFCLACAGSGSLLGWGAFAHVSWPAGASMQEMALELVTSPETWIIGASWVLAAVIASLGCSRGSRVLAACCMVLAGVLAVAAAGVSFGAAGQVSFDIVRAAPSLAGAIIMTIAAALHVPERPFEDVE